MIASVGQIIVPVAVQQTLDHGLNGPDGPDVRFTVLMGIGAAVALLLTSLAAYGMTRRLFTSSERGLATLRIKAFRHVHDLPLLTQNTERRGALVSRVTSDVDQVSQFLVFGGLLLVVSVGQVLVATIVMLIYSWQLTVVVWLCFAPLFLSLRFFQRKLSDAYGIVRQQVGLMLSAISEPVVGAAVVRSYAVEARTQARIDDAISEYQRASTRAQGFTAFSFSLGGISAGLANAGVIIVGIWLGFAGDITSGKVLAFAFLVSLFVGPVQMGTQILTDGQNAIAGWRRVIGILETPADLVDPGPDGRVLPRGPLDVRLDGVTFAYPGGPPVLRDVDLDLAAGTRLAVVGETGSGKSTIAKLVTRLMDPPRRGRCCSTASTSARSPRPRCGAAWSSFRRRGSSSTTRSRRTSATASSTRPRPRSSPAADDLGLGDWVAGLPARDPDPGRPARRVLVRGGAAAGRAAACPARRPRPAGPRRGHQRRRPGPRDADRPRSRATDERPDLDHHRPPALHGRERRRGRRRRPGPNRPAWPPRRPGRPGGFGLRRPARQLGQSARDTGAVTSLDPEIAGRLKRTADGLVPAVVQQHDTGEVLMLGWMDDEALARTLTTGRATYWSRSRQEYWVKGETSGHVQWVKEVRLDCDGDTLLVKVDQVGAACHTGDRTCFDADLLLADGAECLRAAAGRSARSSCSGSPPGV